MKCTKCSTELTDGCISAEFIDGTREQEIDIVVTCPNRDCRNRHYTFVETSDLVSD